MYYGDVPDADFAQITDFGGIFSSGSGRPWRIATMVDRASPGSNEFDNVGFRIYLPNGFQRERCDDIFVFPSSSNVLEHCVTTRRRFRSGHRGGVTVIVSPPNPVGQLILQDYFPEKVSPFKLFLNALIPAVVVTLSLNYL
jgi:hypothetical protein